jgi:hypothetical protein
MTAEILILVVVLVLFLLVWKVVRPGATSSHVCHLNTKQSEIDIDVLGLLLSRTENEYLRESLPCREFRRLRRARVSLARTYLKAINRNTGEFIRAAEAVRSSNDAEVAQAAHELLSIAFRIRLNVPIVQCCLLTEWLFPALSLIASPKLDIYRQMVKTIVFILQRAQAANSNTSLAG